MQSLTDLPQILICDSKLGLRVFSWILVKQLLKRKFCFQGKLGFLGKVYVYIYKGEQLDKVSQI